MTKRTRTLTESRTSEAYRGYLIQWTALRPGVWIEKDGFHISYAESIAAAKTIIDSLV